MSVVVIGAGMAGLLCSAMLRGQCYSILEHGAALPNNHSAVLRFRSPIVGDTLGIPFKKVSVIKAVKPYGNPIAEAVAYSIKTNGTASLRSSITARGDISERYIAPSDLIPRMAQISHGKIKYNTAFDNGFEGPTISTIPMPSLMDILGYPKRKEYNFDKYSGTNIIVQLRDCNIYSSLYVPDPSVRFSRVSITGSEMIIEIRGSVDAAEATSAVIDAVLMCGFDSSSHVISYEVKTQSYAKILPIDEDARKRFIQWATQEHGVFSLGRYAVWRPGLLLDDLVNDVRVIQRIMTTNHFYDQI